MKMNRYSIINKESTHACMEQSPAGDFVPYQDALQLERELNDLRKTAGFVADWLERSHQIKPADMVARNILLAKELRHGRDA